MYRDLYKRFGHILEFERAHVGLPGRMRRGCVPYETYRVPGRLLGEQVVPFWCEESHQVQDIWIRVYESDSVVEAFTPALALCAIPSLYASLSNIIRQIVAAGVPQQPLPIVEEVVRDVEPPVVLKKLKPGFVRRFVEDGK